MIKAKSLLETKVEGLDPQTSQKLVPASEVSAIHRAYEPEEALNANTDEKLPPHQVKSPGFVLLFNLLLSPSLTPSP